MSKLKKFPASGLASSTCWIGFSSPPAGAGSVYGMLKPSNWNESICTGFP